MGKPTGESPAQGQTSPAPASPAQLEPFLSGRRALRILLLAGLTIVCLAPFLGKAFHIDDPLFVWVAKQIQADPGNPYGFSVNWYGFRMPMSDATKNPPLTSYYIAAVAAVTGYREEWAIHLAFLLPAIIAIVGTYLLAERMCRRPLAASLCTLFTPAFIVSSSNVMSDTMMLALWVVAMVLWIEGQERRSWLLLTLAGISIALCSVAKYFGMSLIPLLFVYSVVRERRITWSTALLLVPVILVGLYEWATRGLYGRDLLLDAATYATGTGGNKYSFWKVLVGLGFTGGCLGATWFFAVRSWRRPAVLAAIAAAILVAGAVWSAWLMGRFDLDQGSQSPRMTAGLMGLFVVGGLSVLLPAVLALARRRDPDEMLLSLWVLGTFGFAAVVNWSTNARSILPLVPAAAIMMMRRLERLPRAAVTPRQVIAGLAASAVVALGVGGADLDFANGAREAAVKIHEKYGGQHRRVWFEGHWGFQYYMEELGAKAPDSRTIYPGDIIAIPETNTNMLEWPAERLRLLETIEVPGRGWISTMRLGAGFYTDAWGPLPFAVGRLPGEHYRIYEGIPPQ